MALNTDDSRSPYVQIAEKLRSEIESGAYEPGEKLPTGRELESQWAVSLGTVQRALDLLRRDGLIYGIQGKGNFVRSDPGQPATDHDHGNGELRQQVAQLSDELEDVKERLGRLEHKTKRAR